MTSKVFPIDVVVLRFLDIKTINAMYYGVIHITLYIT